MSIKFSILDYCFVLLVPDEFDHHWNLKIIAIFRRVMFSKQFFLLSIIYTNNHPIVKCSICLVRSVFYLSLNGRLVADRFTPYECQVGVTLSSEFFLLLFGIPFANMYFIFPNLIYSNRSLVFQLFDIKH